MGLFIHLGQKMGPKKESKPHKPRNYVLGGSGVSRFSQARMYKKHGVFKLKNRKFKKAEDKKKDARMVTKQIGGEKNGGTRTVRVNRLPKFYPTEDRPRKLKSRKNAFSQHKHSIRSTITPGTVLILVAGRHRGKRVVFLKQLASGLLLVTGPFHLNGCPLRRINQIYVIATQTRININNVKVPENLNDSYFKRKQLKKPKHTEGEIFDTEKEKYAVSDERKKDQAEVDKQVLDAIRK